MRIVHLFGDSGELFVPGVKPKSQSQPDSEYVEQGLMRRYDRDERIVMPLGQPDHDKNQHWKQDEQFKRSGEFAY